MALLREHDSKLLILDSEEKVVAVTPSLNYDYNPIDLQDVCSLAFGIKLDADIPGADEGKLTFVFQFSSDDDGSPLGDWTDGSPAAIMPRFKQPPNNTLETTDIDLNGNRYQQPVGVAGDAPKRYVRLRISVGLSALTEARTVTVTPIVTPLLAPSQAWKKTGKFPDDGRA